MTRFNSIILMIAGVLLAGCVEVVETPQQQEQAAEISLLQSHEITINTRLAPGGGFREHSRTNVRGLDGLPVGTFDNKFLFLDPRRWTLQLGGEDLDVDLPQGHGVLYNRGSFAFLQESGATISVYSLHSGTVVREISLPSKPSMFMYASDGAVWATRAGNWVRYAPGGSEGVTMDVPTDIGSLLDAWGTEALMAESNGDRLVGRVVAVQPLTRNGVPVH